MLGQLPFFVDFLKKGGLFDLVRDKPRGLGRGRIARTA